ncbi:unnamed protein product [Choristocarpus tenellus]
MYFTSRTLSKSSSQNFLTFSAWQVSGFRQCSPYLLSLRTKWKHSAAMFLEDDTEFMMYVAIGLGIIIGIACLFCRVFYPLSEVLKDFYKWLTHKEVVDAAPTPEQKEESKWNHWYLSEVLEIDEADRKELGPTGDVRRKKESRQTGGAIGSSLEGWQGAQNGGFT